MGLKSIWIEDKFGRLWPQSYQLCDECGQPSNYGCKHEKLPSIVVLEYGGRITTVNEVKNTKKG